MRNVKLLLIGLLFATSYAVAGGAAAFVARKSNTGEFTFSEATQQAFLKDCSENANEWVCGCVLARLQGSYSEKEYLRLDAEMQKGYQDYNFTSFLSDAVAACDKEYEETSSQITEEEAKEYAEKWLKSVKKKDFVSNCPLEMKSFYGKKDAEKVCGCFYDRLAKDKKRFMQVIMDEGYPDDDNMWGLDLIAECVPDKFTPEMEKNFINLANQYGLPKSMGQCILKEFKKEYSLKSLVASGKKGKDYLALIFGMLASKCVVE